MPSVSKPKGLQPRDILATSIPQSSQPATQSNDLKEVPLKDEPLTVHDRVQRANLEWDVSEQTQIISTVRNQDG